jgi:hypothetical protein
MPAPLVPLALGAGLALWTLYEQQRAKERHGTPATTPVTSLPPVPLMPGAAPYLPPVAAPEPIRNLMANALFSQNPVALRTAARNIRELGYAELAAILDARAAQLEPPKAVAGAWFGDHAGHHRAAMLGMHRRRARVGDDFEFLAAAAGAGVSGEELLSRRRAFLRRARVSGALGNGPPIYVGASQALRRRQLLRRLLRGD